MTVPFHVGYFNQRELAEWDGSNQQDICDWINTKFNSASRPAWTVVSVVGSTLTLNGWNGGFGNTTANLVVPLNGWVGVIPGFLTPPELVPDKDLYWASDVHGRPAAAADVEAP